MPVPIATSAPARTADHWTDCSVGQISVKPLVKKYSDFQNTKSGVYPLPSRPTQKGRFAIVTKRRCGMRWTRGSADERCNSRTAKSCGPDASVVGVKSVEFFSAGDGVKQARSPGRARSSLLKPTRAGMPGSSGGPVVTNSCVFYHFTREAVGALGARHSPRPLGRKRHSKLGRFTSRERGFML